MRRVSSLISPVLILTLGLVLVPGLVVADDSILPEYRSLEPLVLPEVQMRRVLAADEERVLKGRVPHYAHAIETEITPWGDDGQWQPFGEMARWRLRLQSNGAQSLNLGFTQFHMPPGGSLTISAADGSSRLGPFTEADNDAHGQLWTPPILGSDIVLEVILPLERERFKELNLELGRVNHGYVGFGDPEPKAGPCHVDVACSDDDTWADPARSVGLVSVEGVRFCSGFLVNNTALDARPFFVTAHHCGIDETNAASVVVMWNHQRTSCPVPEDSAAKLPEIFDAFQTGATLRAANRLSDAVLVELDDPPSPNFNVFFAGWDRSGSLTDGAVVIHHPNTDAKRISFDFDAAQPTRHLEKERFRGGSHLRVGQWEIGSTEGGSSGAPLFDQNRRVVGQLHGGYAACGNRGSDWFGRFSVSWNGNGEPNTRFSEWLDPLNSGAVVLDGIDASSLLSAPIEDPFQDAPPTVRRVKR